MDLEYFNQNTITIQSSNQAQQNNHVINKRIQIENLPTELLLKIMKFLDIKDIFYILNATSREFYALISMNTQFKQHLYTQIFKRSTGLQLSLHCGLEEENIIKALHQPHQINSPIPFYGYATNGGFDQLSEQWIDTAFIKGLWSICSQENTSNVNIAGSTLAGNDDLYSTYLYNYEAIEDTVCNICRHIKYNYNGEGFSFNFLKRILYTFSLEEFEDIEKLYRAQLYNTNQYKQNHEQVIGLVKISTDLYQKISLQKKLNLPVQQKVIEDTQSLLCQNTINILTGVQISREGFFSCPVRTLMIFGSNIRIKVDKNFELDYYNDLNNDGKLEQIISNKNLKVVDTNIEALKQKSTYFDEQTEFKFAVFSNQQSEIVEESDMVQEENQQQQNLIPIAWVQYTTEYIDYICLQFRRMNYFKCKYIGVKLIDCDNRQKEQQQSTNIDFNYIQFYGMQIKPN